MMSQNSTWPGSQSDVRDEVPEELDRDAPASDQPGKQIILEVIQNRLDAVGASMTTSLQNISQQLLLSQNYGFFPPPPLEF